MHVPSITSEDDFSKLSEGVVNWNSWRERNRDITPRLRRRKLDLELLKANLRGATLVDIDFSALNLSQADLTGATLVRCKFDGADLSGADFSSSNCAHTSFDNSTLSNCVFKGSYFSDCTFNEAKGDGIIFLPLAEHETPPRPNMFPSDRDTEFHRCDFSRAKFNNIEAQVTLVNCEFFRAEFIAATFHNAAVKDSDFSAADLRDVHFDDGTLSHVNFRHAVLAKTGFRRTLMRDVDFRGAKFDNQIDFSRSRFIKVRLEHEDIGKAQLQTKLTPAQTHGLIVGSDLVYLKRNFTGFKRWLHIGALLVFVSPYVIYLIRVEISHEVISQTLTLRNRVRDDLTSAIDRSKTHLISAIPENPPVVSATTIKLKDEINNEATKLRDQVSTFLNNDFLNAGKVPLYVLLLRYIRYHDAGPNADLLDSAAQYFFYFLLAYNVLRTTILFKTSQLEHEEEILKFNTEFSFHDYPGWGRLYNTMMAVTLPYYVVVLLHTWEYFRKDRYYL